MQIEEHEIDVGLVQHLIGQVRIAGGDHLASDSAQCAVQRAPQRGLVVDDQHSRGHDAAARLSGRR